MIDELIADKLKVIDKSVDTDVDLVYEAMDHVRKIMSFENNGTTSRLLDFLKICASSNVAADPLGPTEKQLDNLIS